MKNIFRLAVFLLCAGPSFAGPYYGVTQSTVTGRAVQHIAGEIRITASTSTAEPSITLNGAGLSSFANPVAMPHINGDIAVTGTMTAAAYLGDGSKLTGIITDARPYVVPVGTVFAFAAQNCPADTIAADGADISTSAHSALFGVIGHTYDTYTSSAVFKTPDLRGYFVRGYDAGAGVDTGRVFGSKQEDMFKAHSHPSGAVTQIGMGGGDIYKANNNNNAPTGETGVTETRPRNIALRYCIAYRNTAVYSSTGTTFTGTVYAAGGLESTGTVKIFGTGSGIMFPDGTTQSTAGGSGGTVYSTSTVAFNIGEVYVSSLTYPAFANMYALFRSTGIEITGIMAYAEYASTVAQTAFDIVIATQTSGVRSWSSIFTSTVPWLAANTVESGWFVPDTKTASAAASGFALAPRILNIPPSGTLPQLSILVRYKRKLDE